MFCGAGCAGVGFGSSRFGISRPYLIYDVRNTHERGQDQDREKGNSSQVELGAPALVVSCIVVGSGYDVFLELVVELIQNLGSFVCFDVRELQELFLGLLDGGE